MKTIAESAQEMQKELVEVRNWLHQNPELGFKEVKTTRYIIDYLEKLGIEVVAWGGETGVIGLLKGIADGPVVALRGDIDGLPIQEQNECAYRSQTDGLMHACGHDVHTAWMLGAAALLAERRNELKGGVKFVFQPAEELVSGARAMVDKGVLDNPRVDAIFGVHNNPNISVGQIGLKGGPLMASTDTTFIKVRGKGGHGAMPHKANDPIMAAAAIIQGLQTLVSRKVDPLEPVVVSFGSIHGGAANNVIPEFVEMTGTVRTFNPEVRAEMPAMMRKLVEEIASAYGTEAELVYREDLPTVINSDELAAWARAPLNKVFGENGVICPTLSTGAEDFAVFLEDVPGVFLFIGVGNEAKGIVNQWHNPRFDIDEDALPLGAAALAQIAYDWVNKQ